MAGQVTRHFLTLTGHWGTRQVHYRRAGRGPLVLMLHQSPQSSREMIPLMRAWAGDCTLVAPDSPGYGWSDPLPGEALTLEDFAAATLEFADAIGATRFGIYGYHTGSSIGLLLAARYPERISALAANGLILPTAAERADLLEHYLPPLVPRWDGSHLAWAWARLREQAVFFPWYARAAATRMDYDLPPPERLQFALMDLLGAGAHYASAYRGAFACRSEEQLPGLGVPTLVTAAPRDPLAAHLARIGAAPSCLGAEPAGDPDDALARCHRHLVQHPGESCGPPPATTAVPHRPWRQMVDAGTGRQLCWLRRGTPGDRPLLLLHGAARSARAALAGTPALPGRELIAPDLPGHGASDGWDVLPADPLDDIVGQLSGSLAAAGLADCLLAGSEGGGLLALELAARLGHAEAPLLVNPPLWTNGDRAAWRAAGLPPLTPQWHGGHLLEAWHMIRDGRLFYPWFLRERSAIRRGDPDLDEARLHAEVVDLLRAQGTWQALLTRLLDYRWEDAAMLPGKERVVYVDPGLAASQGRFRPQPDHRLVTAHELPAAWLSLTAG
jgi:pimeloyl-ACP methyl ester carboxylesterase